MQNVENAPRPRRIDNTKGPVIKYLLGGGGGWRAEGLWWGHEIILADLGGPPKIFNDEGWATKHKNKVSA